MDDPLPERSTRRIDWRVVVAGVFGIYWLWSAAHTATEWWTLTRLVQRGHPARATLTSTTIEGAGRRAEQVVHYEFSAPDGTKRSGIERFSRGRSPDLDPLKFDAVIEQGSLEARFLPDHPSVHRLNPGFPLRLSNMRLYTFSDLVPA